jgi:Tat protein translocase TatC
VCVARSARAAIIVPMPPPNADAQHDPVEASRMTVGEHLEELRSRILRSLIALIVASLLLIWPSRHILGFLVRPVVLALRRHGQPDNLLQTGPTELISIYIKVVLIAGIVLAAPYILYQLWQFVAAGLYPRERRWVTRLFPFSVGLFFAGVTFMYTLVLLVSLNWLVGFGSWVPLPKVTANPLERLLLDERSGDVGALDAAPGVPVARLARDPAAAEDGQVWFNAGEHKLKLRSGGHTYAVQMLPDDDRPLVTTYFRVGDYLSFVLMMTIAFGAAFQVPLVVMALVRVGVVTVRQFRQWRRVVILLIVVLAGVLAPPDLISHLLLSVPMILLFELGLLLAARQRPPRPRDDPAAAS